VHRNAIAILVALVAQAGFTAALHAQTVTVKRGGSAELGSVYWVRSCFSALDDFEGITIKSGPPGVSLNLRRQDVQPVRQGCSNLVPGAVVVATVGPDARLGTATIEYKVNYRTKTGAKEQSNHSRTMAITQ
jgi:hypothetical protein